MALAVVVAELPANITVRKGRAVIPTEEPVSITHQILAES